MELLHYNKKIIGFAMVLLAILLGLSSTQPIAVWITAGVLLIILYIYCFLRFPGRVLVVFSFFYVFQDLIVFNLGKDSVAGSIIQWAGTGLIWLNLLLLLMFKSEGVRRFPGSISLLIFALLGILSAGFEQVPIVVVIYDILLSFKPFAVLLTFLSIRHSDEDLSYYSNVIKLLLFVEIMGAVLNICLGQRFLDLINNRMYNEIRLGILSIQSWFVHPGLFGWFMAYSVCLALAWYLNKKGNKPLLIGIVCFSLAVLSMRRKPVGGILLIICLIPFLTKKKSRNKMIFYIITVAAATLMLFGNRLEQLFYEGYSAYINVDPETVPRTAMYLTSWKLARDCFPLGAGFGRFGGAASVVFYSPLYVKYGLTNIPGVSQGQWIVDTFWPKILGETGFLGLLVYISLVFSILKSLIRSYRLNLTSTNRFLTMFAIFSLIEGLVETSAGPVFLINMQAYFIMGLVGLALSRSRDEINAI